MMTLDRVSEAFAFVAKNAEFTNSILFAEDEVPEIRAEERDAIAGVMDHIRASYVALLRRCRDDLLARAAGDDAVVATMRRNWNRDDSLWERCRVEIPILIQASYVEAANFWIDEEASRPGVLSLVGEIWTQTRRRDALRQVGSQCKVPLFMSTAGTLRVLASELVTDTSFADLSGALVETLWKPLTDVRLALAKND